jgi:hypothetical protein
MVDDGNEWGRYWIARGFKGEEMHAKNHSLVYAAQLSTTFSTFKSLGMTMHAGSLKYEGEKPLH